MLREVAWALAYAHGRGIVHRDVKPDNIIIEEETGRALVMDFGIARTDAVTSSTASGKIMGTAQFMSPEQATSEAVDGRSDLYSLGAVGYLAVSGRLPFEAANIPALLLKQVTETAQRVDTIAPGVPPILASAIERCLEKDPSARFSDGEELAAALAPVGGDRPPLPLPLRKWLASRDPARVPYAMWSVFTAGTAANNYFSYFPNIAGVFVLSVLTFAPLVPLVIYQAAQARRLFRAGFTINDLRSVLNFARSEREQQETYEQHDHSPAAVFFLRVLTLGSIATAISVSFFPDTALSANMSETPIFPEFSVRG